MKVDEGLLDEKATDIQLTFDQTVTITESFYPGISPTKIFSDLGGSLGLWLGVGVVQILGGVYKILLWTKKKKR